MIRIAICRDKMSKNIRMANPVDLASRDEVLEMLEYESYTWSEIMDSIEREKNWKIMSEVMEEI